MKLTCKLNKIKYLLVEIPIKKEDVNYWKQNFDKYDCIFQSSKYINNGILGNSVFLFRILVPEKNIIKFNKEKI